jgi:hypothetical protein
MKKLAQLLLYPALALGVLFFCHAALSQELRKPLVVVRFNQGRVYYEQPLYQAVSKAVAVKPDVMFDVISAAPYTGDPQVDARWQQQASSNTQKVLGTMQKIGVPLSRMQVSGARESGLSFDEVRVYVR